MTELETCLTAIKELEKRIRLEFDLHYKACVTNSQELSDKLAKLNDFRNAMADEAQRTEEGIGKRLSALELVKANFDGKFWALSFLIIIFQLILQFWPLVRSIKP